MRGFLIHYLFLVENGESQHPRLDIPGPDHKVDQFSVCGSSEFS